MIAEDARAGLLQIINGFQASQAIHVAATLGVADLLASGPKSIADLATATETQPVALYRLMRALASIGVFKETHCQEFTLSPKAEFLRSDIAGSHAPMARLIGRANFWQAWGDLLYAVRTGTTAFDHVHGQGVWEFRSEQSEENAIFDRAMASGTERHAEAVMAIYDFGSTRHVIDVGGGDGAFICKLLSRFPLMQGTLFDQPHVIARAMRLRRPPDIEQRCQMRAGNFFVDVPEGADAYLLKWVLHDWDDTAATGILRSCRRAMGPASRLVIVEHIVGAPNHGPDGKFMDLTMMVMCGGRERTREQFAALLAEAGFQMQVLLPTAGPQSVIVASPTQE